MRERWRWRNLFAGICATNLHESKLLLQRCQARGCMCRVSLLVLQDRLSYIELRSKPPVLCLELERLLLSLLH